MKKMFIREELIQAIRAFFAQQHFHEVVVPVLNQAIPIEPTLFPFTTTWQTNAGNRQLFLSTSPESGLKKMLAQGIGPCFAIGKSFRNLENAGAQHNPEFLMLEWYRPDATFHDIMNDVQHLIRFCAPTHTLLYQGKKIDLQSNWQTQSLVDLLRQYAHIDLEKNLTDQQLQKTAARKGYNTADASWEQLFHQIVLNEVEPHFPHQPFFLTDFPARTSPLCQPDTQKPYLAQRFEFFLGGVEIGNGNTENTNTEQVTEYFNAEREKRSHAQQTVSPIDQDFLRALQKMQRQSFAGIGVGVDRLAMIFADAADISEVEPFAIRI